MGPCIEQERTGVAFHRPAFTRDGRLMAVGIAPDQILLADAATGRGLARLTTLQPVFATPLVFSPDGTTLVAKTDQKTVLVWNLRRIRDQLDPRGLDWNAPLIKRPWIRATCPVKSPGRGPYAWLAKSPSRRRGERLKGQK